MSKALLLPSAKLVPAELQSDFGFIPSAMIPLGSHPAIHYISRPYIDQDYLAYVAIHEGADLIQDYLANRSDLPIIATEVGPTRNLGETVLAALKTMTDTPEELVINFADTYLEGDIAVGDTVYYREQEDVFRWTTFELDSSANMVNLGDKNRARLTTLQSLPVFIGVFSISRFHAFRDDLAEACERSGVASELDPFYQAIARYFNRLRPDEKNFQKADKWWDFGHLDTYYAMKKGLFLNVRHFNSVHVDARRGILRKTSRNVQKFAQEVLWYSKLPVPLQYMVPRVFSYDLSRSDPFVDLEFYGYPALNDMYLYGHCDLGAWNNIFDAIELILDDMGRYHLEDVDSDAVMAGMQEMYEQKTVGRLGELANDDRFATFFGAEVVINGCPHPGLGRIMAALPDVIGRSGIYRDEVFSVCHGDLCLSNILYDQRSRIVRVIDPRGTFGSFDLYGDPRYDMAKLCHSIEGDYDFIVNGLFQLTRNGDELAYRTYVHERHRNVKKLFNDRFRQLWGEEKYAQVKLIEALLFLSMVPLHRDQFEAQQVFIAKGIELFSEFGLGVASVH